MPSGGSSIAQRLSREPGQGKGLTRVARSNLGSGDRTVRLLKDRVRFATFVREFDMSTAFLAATLPLSAV